MNECDYSRFTSLASRIFKVPITLVTWIDLSHFWFIKTHVELDLDETLRYNAVVSCALLKTGHSLFSQSARRLALLKDDLPDDA
jgi:hypothetical protein